MATLPDDLLLYAKSTVGTYASLGCEYREFLRRFRSDWGQDFDAGAKKAGFRNGLDALDLTAGFEVSGDKIYIEVSQQNAHIVRAIDTSNKAQKNRGTKKKPRQLSPLRLVSTSAGNFVTNRSYQTGTSSVTAAYKHNPNLEESATGYRPFGWDGANHAAASTSNGTFNEAPSRAPSGQHDRPPQRLLTPASSAPSEKISPESVPNRLGEERPPLVAEGERSGNWAMHNGVLVYFRPMEAVMPAVFKRLQLLFRDIDAYGDSNTLPAAVIKEAIERYELNDAMDLTGFAHLHSWLRPEWSVEVLKPGEQQVVFTPTGKPPKPFHETLFEATHVPKRTLPIDEFIEATLLGATENALIYIRPLSMRAEYRQLRSSLKWYTKLFNLHLKTNLEGNLKAVFLSSCALYYDDGTDLFLRCQVVEVVDETVVRVFMLDEGFEREVAPSDLFPIPKRICAFPNFCFQFQSSHSDLRELSERERHMIRTVVTNLSERKGAGIFSMRDCRTNADGPDVYRGFWKPAPSST
ncbi:hypothetical protein M3Y99_00851900 [Aphelenchoides fujianensis]|nr:hypothetical protein M3Y99_00851900 [Aphelenchoides fujianensis]